MAGQRLEDCRHTAAAIKRLKEKLARESYREGGRGGRVIKQFGNEAFYARH